jgi:tetratricopeptide (TPR) repeat protein
MSCERLLSLAQQKADPQPPEMALAIKEHNSGNYQRAIGYLEPLLDAKKRLPSQDVREALFLMAHCYRRLHRIQVALEHIQRFLEFQPCAKTEYARGLQLKAQLLMDIGDLTAARVISMRRLLV